MVDNQSYFVSDLFPDNVFTAFLTVKTVSFTNKSLKKTAEKIKDFVSRTVDKPKDLFKVVFMDQRHTTNTAVVTKDLLLNSDFTVLDSTDAVITNLKNTILVAKTADCLPVVYAGLKFIAISHQGWIGSFANLAEKVILKLQLVKERLTDIRVAIGPHIGACCYSIDKNRQSLFRLVYKQWQESIFVKLDNSTTGLNLLRLNLLQCQQAGLSLDQIDSRLFCTACDTRFASYRRDKTLDKQNISLILKL
ncbi:MAG: laccase domain protein [Patescibacteria group bacterium]|nr:MAG: laccase domain protein [Patescibacteria group bacterium]